MQTVQLTLPRPHKAQDQILKEARRFNVLCCGRRFGKDILGINRAVETLLLGYPVGWFSPTYKMMSEVWREAVETLNPVTIRSNAQERRLELITGGTLELWSLDQPDSARGRKYKRVIINEAAMIAKLQEAWQNVIRPTLTDYQGDAWFLSTPKGMGFFRTCFDLGQDEFYPDWQSWQMPTSANPHIKPEEIEAARQELPERVFAQEYLAVFLQDAGGVFRNVRAIATEPRKEPYQGEIVGGLDWAQESDFTVVTAFDASTGRMVDMDRFNQIGWSLQRGRVRAFCEKWHIGLLVAEKNSIGGPNIEALQAEGLPVVPFETTATSKGPLIESWALAFEKGETRILSDPVLIAEHEAYERTVSRETGRSKYSAPEGMHDDTVMACALGWYAVQGGGMVRIRRL